jgi:hypothetical protein
MMKKILFQISNAFLLVIQIPVFIFVGAFIFQRISLVAYRFFAPAFTLIFLLLVKLNWVLIPIALLSSLMTLSLAEHKKLKFFFIICGLIPLALTLIISFF